MKSSVISSFILLLLVPVVGFSMSENNEDYWQCNAHDNAHNEWTAKNVYQKIALNVAFDACKKQSKSPLTCSTSQEDCEQFHLGRTTRPFWSCTAMDRTATPWSSNYYTNREDAALAAKAYCQSKSALPDTCYIDLVTCTNANSGD